MTFRIHCPLSRENEVEPLVAAGADEFYAGLIPETSGANQNFVNRRSQPENNFVEVASFLRAQAQIHERAKKLFVTFNEHYYPDEVYGLIFALLDRLLERPGLTGVIVAEINLVLELRARYPELAITASTGLNNFNGEAVRMFLEMGVSRVVLPREIRMGEIAAMKRRCPEIVLEAFVLNDRCPNVDGMCNLVHKGFTERKFVNECKHVTLEQVLRRGAATRSPPDDVIERNFNEACGFEDDACAACALPELLGAGVSHMKIVGRDRRLGFKLRDVAFLAELRCMLEAGPGSPEAFRIDAKSLRARHFGAPCSDSLCYYST